MLLKRGMRINRFPAGIGHERMLRGYERFAAVEAIEQSGAEIRGLNANDRIDCTIHAAHPVSDNNLADWLARTVRHDDGALHL